LVLFRYRNVRVNHNRSVRSSLPDRILVFVPLADNPGAGCGLRSLYTTILVLLVIGLLGGTATAGDKPFDMSANWGGTGLMEIPTARILPDGAMRLGVAKAAPYIWYTFGFGVLPGLEFTSRYTDITNLPSGVENGFGSYKDKAFDIKYQLLPESKNMPAIALGWNDFHGTRLFEAQYLVLSRQLYPLDITLGVGRKRLKGPIAIADEFGFWGGVEWAATDRLHLMLEYNPIEYELDPLPSRGVPEGSDSPFNVGLRYRTWLGFDLGVSYQRGDTLGMAVHLQFELGRPILPPRPDPPSWQFAADQGAPSEAPDDMARRLAEDMQKAGFTDVATGTTDGVLVAEFENNRYFSNAKAAGRVLRLMLHHTGSGITRLTAVMKRDGLKILYVSAATEDARGFFMGDMSTDRFARRLQVTPGYPKQGPPAATAEQISAATRRNETRRTWSYGVSPVLESFFDQSSGAYQSRLSLTPHATFDPWPGAAVHGSYEFPLYSDIETKAETLPDAVRSDAWKYLGSQSGVDRLLVNQMVKLTPTTYARVSAGYLERMYAGVGGEVLTFLDQGRWAVGVEGDLVRKRDPDDLWHLLDQQNHTLLGNIYYHYLPLDITLRAQVGRFLAGDAGVRLEFRRRYDTGAEIGFWYSMTDTDTLTDFNRDYSDKGIFLRLPFATFTDRPTRTLLTYRISPWTRDVGATIDHWQEVYDTAADLTPLYFGRDMDRLGE
jgi:Exopolysaccharide biosynthesis protein YbjH